MLQRKQPILYFGPYETPRFKYGAMVTDESRGRVKIVGLSDARIPWPIGKGGRVKSLVLYKGLARGSCGAQGTRPGDHWWGMGFKPVTRWRKALHVKHDNVGTILLRKANAQLPAVRRGLKKCWTMPRSLEWRMKIGAHQMSKRMPARVRKVLSKAHRGKKLSAGHCRKIQDAHLRRVRPGFPNKPWRAWEDALLRLPLSEIVTRTGRSLYEIHRRRRELLSPVTNETK
jgi:hypothetical protein